LAELVSRIAKAAGLDEVQSFDHHELHWQAEPMFPTPAEPGSRAGEQCGDNATSPSGNS
jgi:hypothetical protein